MRGRQEGESQRGRVPEGSRSPSATGQQVGMQTLEAGKGKEMPSSLEPPEGRQPCQPF